MKRRNQFNALFFLAHSAAMNQRLTDMFTPPARREFGVGVATLEARHIQGFTELGLGGIEGRTAKMVGRSSHPSTCSQCITNETQTMKTILALATATLTACTTHTAPTHDRNEKPPVAIVVEIAQF